MTNSFNPDIERELHRAIKGEIRFSEVDRVLYSTDASNYKIKPAGVVIPKTEADVVNTINIARSYEIPVIPRGGGSGLAGQAIGRGIVLDFSKYLNKIKFLDAENKTVLVQPGLNLQMLNDYLDDYGLMFGPDPSSASVATIGGVISNNATGAHSILYGMSGDNLKSARIVLSDGSCLKLSYENYGNEYLEEELNSFIKKNRDLISKNFPKHWRRASGYSLNYILENNFNPAKLLASSEGTLCAVTELELALVDKPKHKGLCVLQFEDLIEALENVPEILSCNPSAIELVGGLLLELTRKHQGFSKYTSIFGQDTKAVLLVEFYGASEKDIVAKTNQFADYSKGLNTNSGMEILLSEKEQKAIWNLRKAGLGLLMSEKSDYKPIPCIEDVSIPVENLSLYTDELTGVLKNLDLKAGYYGHASAGCLHIRPLINLADKKGVSDMMELIELSAGLAQKFSGVLSGEHGDGLQRSIFNEKLFGKQIYSAMKDLKQLFDPINLFNPGKIVDADPADKNLRLGRTNDSMEFKTYLDWSEDRGIKNAAIMCNGQGVCRRLDEGIMCPSFKATRDESDTTRARANILRSILSGDINSAKLYERDFYNVFDLCIGCKACKTECPSGVDVSKMKTEYHAQYKKVKGFTLRDRLFSNIHSINSVLSRFPNLSNLMQQNILSKHIFSLLGVDKRRKLPLLSSKTFSGWFEKFGNSGARDYSRQVVYFNDTWTEYIMPSVGKSIVNLFNNCGFEVLLETNRICCGRPLISNGMIDKARGNALKNISILSKYSDEGIPIIFSEPSCYSMFCDDYFDLVPESTRLKYLSDNIYLFDEFLCNNKGDLKFTESEEKVFLHGHCHQRSANKQDFSISLLEHLGFNVQNSNAGCCGMAGNFGYEKEHYEVSRLIGNDRLFPAINKIDNNVKVCITGFSCMEQIKHFTDKKPLHVAELLAEKLS